MFDICVLSLNDNLNALSLKDNLQKCSLMDVLKAIIYIVALWYQGEHSILLWL